MIARYFSATGICPVMHTAVIHHRVLENHPWLAEEVLKAFRKDKEYTYKYLSDQRESSLIWERNYYEEEMRPEELFIPSCLDFDRE